MDNRVLRTAANLQAQTTLGAIQRAGLQRIMHSLSRIKSLMTLSINSYSVTRVFLGEFIR